MPVTKPVARLLHTRDSENRVDTTLKDVFQLLSLFFLTIGKSREAPATLCQLAAMKVRECSPPCPQKVSERNYDNGSSY
jgi:hypothetical protein